MLKRQQGFGLVELLIGTAISLVILAAASTVMLSSLTSNRDSIRMARLDQELRQVMTMVSRDLRRASSWNRAVDAAKHSLLYDLVLSNTSGSVTISSSGDGELDNIGELAEGATLIYVVGTTVYRATLGAYDDSAHSYAATLTGTWPAVSIPAGSWSILRPTTSIVTDAVAGTPGECILFVYDTDGDGDYSSDDYIGYRYDSTDLAVDVRTSGTAAETCATVASWQNLTDTLFVEITDFTVTENSPAAVSSAGLNVAVREFTISISGRLEADTSVQRTLRETIRVRNEQIS